jgi:hypothetical protein
LAALLRERRFVPIAEAFPQLGAAARPIPGAS